MENNNDKRNEELVGGIRMFSLTYPNRNVKLLHCESIVLIGINTYAMKRAVGHKN